MELRRAVDELSARINEGPTLAFLILTVALILAPRLAEKLRLPAMVGLVLAGMGLGPHGTALLASDKIALSALGQLGLLYLMFSAGLELDVKVFASMKRAALTFALLSFAIPFTFGLVSARLLHYGWAASVLMGSNWGSHTLVTYPLLRHMGLARNPAVATVVGATAVTDTAALLVLSGVSAAQQGGSVALDGVEIVVGLAALAVWTLFALPRIARWFFARVGTDRSYRFVFGIVAFLSGAVLAESGSIDGIVGAFFAGLGLNRSIPEQSPLMERLQFFGGSLFIPIFLVSVGILLDPRVMVDPKTLVVALVFAAAALGGKALAAAAAGRAFRFSWAEVGVMAGLSGSQAAATLATTLVGARLGLFDKTTINAVLVVILISLILTPAMVNVFGKRVTGSATRETALGASVIVPVWGPSTRPLLRIGSRIAAPDNGIVVAATFAADDASEDELARLRALKDEAEGWLAKEGLEARSMFRVCRSFVAGVRETMRGESATLVVAEWRAEDDGAPDEESLRSMERSPVPLLLARGHVEPFERLVIVARRQDLVRPGRLDLDLAVDLAQRLDSGRPICCVTPDGDALAHAFGAKSRVERVAHADPIGWLTANLRAGDLPLFAGLGAALEAQRRAVLGAGRFLTAVAAHGTAFHERQPDADAVVVGRSATAPAR